MLDLTKWVLNSIKIHPFENILYFSNSVLCNASQLQQTEHRNGPRQVKVLFYENTLEVGERGLRRKVKQSLLGSMLSLWLLSVKKEGETISIAIKWKCDQPLTLICLCHPLQGCVISHQDKMLAYYIIPEIFYCPFYCQSLWRAWGVPFP